MLVCVIAFVGAILGNAVHASDLPEEQTYPFADKDTISILTLGNSYSHYAVAGQTSCLGMIEALGKKGRLALAFQPYGSFSDHWNNHTKPRYCDLNIAVSAGAAPLNVDPATWTIDGALTNENWDIVMLHSSTDEMWHPWTDSWRAEERSAYEKLVALIHEKCPKAKIYLLQFWPVGIFCDKLNPRKTIQEFDAIPVRDAQYENYVRNYDWAFHRFDDDPDLAGIVQKIIPAGYAQILYSYRRPIRTFSETVQLVSGTDKNFHPSNGGYVVQSLTWVRAIFGRLPEKANLHEKYKTILSEHGADLDAAYECVEDACKAAHSRYFTYRENVDFSYKVTIKNYDGTQIGDVQSVTNRGCAILPDPTTLKVGDGYEFAGWRTHMNNPYANDYKTYTDTEMRAFKVFDTLEIIVKRRHTGEPDPERVWTGLGVDNSWNTADNWEPAVVPDEKSDVFIPFPADATNTVTVSVPSAIAINSLTVGSGSGLGRAILSFNINDFYATNTVATTVTVNSNGFITCLYSCQGLSGPSMSRVSSLNYRVTLKSGGNFTINKGGAVDVVSKGFPRGAKVTGLDPALTVPGACGYAYTTGITTWYGGSHGGISGQCKTAPICASTDLYPCYGSIRHPLTLGSSGAVSWGGGGIHLIALGDMLINGDIRANGEDGRYKLLSPDYGSVLYGSGAGGSVWLEAHAFTGTGTVDVRGGVNTEDHDRSRACGGSGRIAIYTQEVFDHAFSVAHEGEVINLLAGPRKSKNEKSETDNYHGGGTIYIETSTHEPGHGVLYIDGGNVGTAGREYATQIGSLVEESGDGDAVFASVVLQNRGRLYLTPGAKLYTRELTIRGDDPLTTCTDSAYDPTLGTVEVVSTHHFGAWVTNTFANCTNAGERVRTCADDGCGLVETNVIAALGHDWGAWVTNPAPTKVSAGLRTRVCQRTDCAAKEEEVLPKLEMCTLTVSATTHGTIIGAESGDYMTNAVVTLTASPESGYRFAGWTGSASGTANPLMLTMDADKTVGATFEESGKPPVGPYPIDPADGWSVSKDGYTVTAYTNVVGTHTYTVPEGVFAIDYLIVGGGGAGANSGNNGGGGGAGGVLTNTVAFSVTPGSSLTVTVGKGGVHAGASNKDCGGNSSLGDLIAYGGGAGCGNKASGKSGGSGGGAGGGGSVSSDVVGGAGTDLQGHAGGTVKAGGSNRGGAGGGGAGAKGDDCSSSNASPSNGGAGIVCSITGEPVGYAAGGGGGGSGVTSAEKRSHGGSAGGVEIGGKGGGQYIAGGKGVDGTGSGGGGTGYTAYSSPGGDGGDGIVIIRYATETPPTPTHTHTWSTWVTNPAPTKVSTGLRTRTCQHPDCGVQEQEVVPQLPDDPDPPTPPPGPGPGPGGDPTPYPIAAGDGWSKVVGRSVVVAFTNVNNNALSFTVPKGVTAIDYLLVGGGGGGGNAHNGGGGGAGGVLTNVISMAVTAGTDISVVVGKGGDKGASGKNSNLGGLVAYGGGAGASASKAAGVGGGSGGGAAGGLNVGSDIVGGSATNGQGHVGGTVTAATRRCGAGGGGAGGPGANATTGNGVNPSGFGGPGIVSAISGEATGYGAGGGGGGSGFAVDSRATGGSANGVVIGGCGGTGSQSATDGINGTGSGGGGAGYADKTKVAGKGGDGIVIIRYATRPPCTLLVVR